MEIMVLLIILAIVVAAASMVIFVLMQQLKRVQNNSAVELIKGDVVELSRSITNLQQTMSDKLERSQLSTQQSVQKQLSESSKLVADVTQRLTKLDETMFCKTPSSAVFSANTICRAFSKIFWRQGSIRLSISFATAK